jgi:hypothetical protein
MVVKVKPTEPELAPGKPDPRAFLFSETKGSL